MFYEGSLLMFRFCLVELVYVYDDEEDFFFVFHGMTPPSRNSLEELGLER